MSNHRREVRVLEGEGGRIEGRRGREREKI